MKHYLGLALAAGLALGAAATTGAATSSADVASTELGVEVVVLDAP